MSDPNTFRLALASAFFASCALLLPAQDLPSKKNVNTPTGEQLYAQHCAVCHGGDLHGAGPFPAPYRKPPDLTGLARRHGGKFPATYVNKVLKHGVTLPAHGPAEMPVWGSEFAAKESIDQAQIADRIHRLTVYLKAHQTP